ncbi:hypothetical protein D6779_00875 [Candidatus Parcubacteria bacterium]|nr:MAG: hypothetical protein D6779_00875 [Candidatus Parcubacteria bacterium]
MQATKQTKFILAVALQVLIIFAIVAFKVAVLAGGTEVILKIEPVDPRDILRGDYVAFRYNISNLDPYLFGNEQVRDGDTVYVILRRSGKYWTAQRAQKTKPTADDQVFIKGKVVSGGLKSRSDPFSDGYFRGSSIHVVYGIEEYYIPEGSGSEFNFGGSGAFAKISVDRNGNAALKQIYVNGKPWP